MGIFGTQQKNAELVQKKTGRVLRLHNTTGTQNTAIGNTTGTNNTAIGQTNVRVIRGGRIQLETKTLL